MAPTGTEAMKPVVRQWVGQTFYGTLMRQARQASFMPEGSPMAGGRGGEAFNEMLHARLAEGAGKNVAAGLVDSITDRLTQRR